MTITSQTAIHMAINGSVYDALLSHHLIDGKECTSFKIGDVHDQDVHDQKELLVRVQSACFTSEVGGSCECDCGIQLDAAKKLIAEEGAGVIIYFNNHEGKGHGPRISVELIKQESSGLSEKEAFENIGLPGDVRDFSIAGVVLSDLGVSKNTVIKVLSGNASKAVPFSKAGYKNTKLTELECCAPPAVAEYLRSKGYKVSDESDGIAWTSRFYSTQNPRDNHNLR